MTSSRVDLDTALISSQVWVESTAKDKVALRCNTFRCKEGLLWEGYDYDMAGEDWMGLAITHLVEFHSELLTST